MWFIFIVAFSYLLPAVAAKSYRTKLIYFLNSLILVWILAESVRDVIKSGYLNNNGTISFLSALIIPVISILSILYFIVGVVKIVSRRKDYINMFKNKHGFSHVVSDFSKELNEEEKVALLFSFPTIVFMVFIFIKNFNLFISNWIQ